MARRLWCWQPCRATGMYALGWSSRAPGWRSGTTRTTGAEVFHSLILALQYILCYISFTWDYMYYMVCFLCYMIVFCYNYFLFVASPGSVGAFVSSRSGDAGRRCISRRGRAISRLQTGNEMRCLTGCADPFGSCQGQSSRSPRFSKWLKIRHADVCRCQHDRSCSAVRRAQRRRLLELHLSRWRQSDPFGCCCPRPPSRGVLLLGTRGATAQLSLTVH